MKLKIFLLLIMATIQINSSQNDFFRELSAKKIATFNDAITLVRLLYNEMDDNDKFLDNVVWAASKKLFKVTIPIKDNEVNPVVTRKEFAYWICGVYNLNGVKSMKGRPSRKYSYNLCVGLGLIEKGRGPDDSFTGLELLDSFSYVDYYVRAKNIKPRDEAFIYIKDEYDIYPKWRKTIYKELDEQRKAEKDKKIKKKPEKKKKVRELKEEKRKEEPEIKEIKVD
ncbi:MAG TPA: hypothetical protein PK385_08115 [Spirochaetota bacterium]|nr:hypothetical protein [Spirochaetota bacterium]HOS32491.1 hypothetical protein [Spirochaetota bacterium]HOS56009.1 hypothetical protein [Spirochaetota bacterium]HPK61064.1 hypothetical protein [Spirochaetota bacterium]HQF76734.1 hypothetical protein [Spirochaetota bacterium]